MATVLELIFNGVKKEELAQKFEISVLELESLLSLYYQNNAGWKINKKQNSKLDYHL